MYLCNMRRYSTNGPNAVWRSLIVATIICTALASDAQPGALDTSFDPGDGAFIVYSSVIQPDGRAIIGGYFLQFDGVARNGIARINADGSLDPSFDPGLGPNGSAVYDVALQPDGKVLACGAFNTFNGEPCPIGLVRLNPDGSVDETFSASGGVPNGHLIRRIVLLPNGKIIVGGDFTSFDGIPRGKIARLNADGTLDPTYLAGGVSFLNGQIYCMAPGPEGSLFVGGDFTQFSGIARGGIVRLYDNGAVDTLTFNPGDGFEHENGVGGFIYAIAVQPDGKVLVGGSFDRYDHTPASGLVRLGPGGTLDAAFQPAANGDWGYHMEAVAVQPDGRIVASGNFTTYHGEPRNILVRLEADGSVDPSFQTGTGPNNKVLTISLRPSGRILIGGWFYTYNGVPRSGVAQVHGTSAPPGVSVAIRALLTGPYDQVSGIMHDGLRSQGLLPLQEPYSDLGYAHVVAGGESTTASVLSATGSDAIVDWVVAELRDAGDPGIIIATRSALIQRDGDVVDTDGVSPLAFSLPVGSYHVGLRHRNHLAVMTASPIALNAAPTTVDFTNPGTSTWGSVALKEEGSKMLLWAGDTGFDGIVQYVGENNDRDGILVAIGGSVPTNVVNGVYTNLDVNLDGSIRYVGEFNDRDLILQAIGGTLPTATRHQQVP